jgi:hypothetical protein
MRRSDVPSLAIEHDPNALQDLRGGLAAPALGPEHLLHLALEVRVAGAWPARDEVLLDLDADAAVELPVEVELEAPQDLGAINR